MAEAIKEKTWGKNWLEGVWEGGVDPVLFLKGSTDGENIEAGKKRKAKSIYVAQD